MDDWRTVVLPPHDGYDWAVLRNDRKSVCMSARHALDKIGRWLPANPVLVAAPGMSHFVPPIAVPELEAQMHDAVVRYWRMLAAATAAAALLFLVPREFAISLSVGALALMFLHEYRCFLRSPAVVHERALFFYWLHDSAVARRGLIAWIVLTCLIGLFQFFMQYRLGSIEGVFDAYGLMYPAARGGEYWRLLSGPFLHYSVLHFITNAAMLVLAGWIASAIRPVAAPIAFFVGCWSSAWSQMTFGGQVYDNFGGMSGGVFAVFALIVVAGALDRRLLPTGLAVVFGGAAVASGIISEVTSETAATVAHVSGAMTGAVVAVIAHRAGSRGRRSQASRAGARP